jgi:hypothetical protein
MARRPTRPRSRPLPRGKSSSAFREMTAAELRRVGRSPGSQQVVSKSVKRVAKNTVTYSRRQWLNRKNVETTGARLSLEKLAERRRTGEISYRTAAAEDQASKQRETRRRQAMIAAALREPPPFSPAATRPARTVRRHGPRHYDISQTRGDVRAALTEKIMGGPDAYIEDGVWHGVMDWLRANNQEELEGLFRTSGRSTPLEV